MSMTQEPVKTAAAAVEKQRGAAAAGGGRQFKLGAGLVLLVDDQRLIREHSWCVYFHKTAHANATSEKYQQQYQQLSQQVLRDIRTHAANSGTCAPSESEKSTLLYLFSLYLESSS